MFLSEDKVSIQYLNELLPVVNDIINLENKERVLHSIVDKLSRHLGCQTCAIVQINPETELLEILNFSNLSWNFCKDYRKKIASPILRELIWKGVPIHIPNKPFASTFADELKMENDFLSCYAVQLSANQQPFGFLYLDSEIDDYFNEERQLIVQFYARLISTTMFLERLSEKLKRLQPEDEDSGAVKFDQFFPKLQDIFERSYRLEEKVSAVLLDIEGYGSIIKLYGLEKARSILKQFVRLIKANLRPYDEISRFGADEFLIVLPGTDLNEAYEVAKKINSLIKNAEFTDQKMKLSLFAGVANFPANCKSSKGLLTATKNALYEAKRMNAENKIAHVNIVYD